MTRLRRARKAGTDAQERIEKERAKKRYAPLRLASLIARKSKQARDAVVSPAAALLADLQKNSALLAQLAALLAAVAVAIGAVAAVNASNSEDQVETLATETDQIQERLDRLDREVGETERVEDRVSSIEQDLDAQGLLLDRQGSAVDDLAATTSTAGPTTTRPAPTVPTTVFQPETTPPTTRVTVDLRPDIERLEQSSTELSGTLSNLIESVLELRTDVSRLDEAQSGSASRADIARIDSGLAQIAQDLVVVADDLSGHEADGVITSAELAALAESLDDVIVQLDDLVDHDHVTTTTECPSGPVPAGVPCEGPPPIDPGGGITPSP